MAMGKANEYQIGGNHYRRKIQHWDYVLANDIPYLEAQIIKYLTRWRSKGGHFDILKAKHFLEKLMESEGVVQPEQYPDKEVASGFHGGLQAQSPTEGQCVGSALSPAPKPRNPYSDFEGSSIPRGNSGIIDKGNTRY